VVRGTGKQQQKKTSLAGAEAIRRLVKDTL
jgi:hypothetical protein